MENNNKIKWNDISNKKIQEELLVLGHEHTALKNKIDKLIGKLEEIEKEYHYGNDILLKRYKGIT